MGACKFNVPMCNDDFMLDMSDTTPVSTYSHHPTSFPLVLVAEIEVWKDCTAARSKTTWTSRLQVFAVTFRLSPVLKTGRIGSFLRLWMLRCSVSHCLSLEMRKKQQDDTSQSMGAYSSQPVNFSYFTASSGIWSIFSSLSIFLLSTCTCTCTSSTIFFISTSHNQIMPLHPS